MITIYCKECKSQIEVYNGKSGIAQTQEHYEKHLIKKSGSITVQSIQGILGSVEYALSKNDITKAERYHLKQILDSVNAIIIGKEYKFECLNCNFKTNNQIAAIKHKPRNSKFNNFRSSDHNLSGPAGWYCTCGFRCVSHFGAIQHKKTCWNGNIIRFDEVKTLKKREVKEAAIV